MSLAAKLRRAPGRVAAGAFILNSGIGKLTSTSEEQAKGVHGMATGTYGFLGKVDPKLFAKLLAAGEITVGGALLLPFVSPVIAGGAVWVVDYDGRLGKVEPKLFLKALGAGEVALGAALLLPIFPAGLVGLGLLGFSGALLTTYVRTPGMHDAQLRPTQQGVPIAKDIWMAGIGAGLVLDAVLSENKSQEEA